MADRGRRAMPVGNRLCQEKWVERCQDLHRDRLRNMRSTASDPRVTTLDNSTPASMSMPHLQLKQKKAQLEEERFAQIELENRILLEKMSKIMRQDPGDARSSHGGHHTEQFPFRSTLQLKPGIRCDMTQYPMLDSRNFIAPKSMNREQRLRELKRITSENQSMLRRIQSREPYYDHTKWEEERVRDLQYLKNIRSREVMALTKTFSRSQSLPPRSRSKSRENVASEKYEDAKFQAPSDEGDGPGASEPESPNEPEPAPPAEDA